MPAKLTVVDGEQDFKDPRTTVFWYRTGKTWKINRERLYAAAKHLGFRLYRNALCQVIDQFIHEREPRFFFDALKDFIKEMHQEEYEIESINNAYETFIQKNGKFSIERIPLILDHEIIKDTKHSCYKFYLDAYVLITAKNITTHPYDQLPGLVFASKVQPRIFRAGNKGRYLEFLNLACNLRENMEYISRIVGYYAHEYNDEGMGYFAVLTESVSDPKLGGGSGKNLFGKLLTLTTSIVDQSGSQTELDDTIFQIWKGQRIFSISDLPKDFDFIFFKNISTGGIIHKRLYKDREEVDISLSPKLIFNTNYSFLCSDGGLRRRIIPLEFTNFFTINGGVEGYFNCWFPTDWNEDDWAGFDGFVTRGIQTWFRSGCKLEPQKLSEGGWTKQFEYAFGSTIVQIIDTFWTEWISKEAVKNDDFKKQVNDFYNDNSIAKSYQPTIKKLHKALEEYGAHFGTEFKADVTRREAHLTYKCRTFIKTGNILAEEDNPF